MEFNKCMYSELKEEKYPRGFNKGNGSRIVKSIFSSFGKAWNNLFSTFFKPNRLMKVSDFQTTSHDIKEYSNEEKCNAENNNVTHFPGDQSIVLHSEPKVLFFPQSLKNYDFERPRTLFIPKQLNMHSFVTIDSPSEILYNVNVANSRNLGQNVTLTNVSENDIEISKIDAKNIHNFHFINEFISSTFFFRRHRSSNVLVSNSEDSCISQSLISSENDHNMDCENKPNDFNIFYGSVKSSANNSFSESSYSTVIYINIGARFVNEFYDFLKSRDVYSSDHNRVLSYVQYLNTDEQVHEARYKFCLKKFWYDTHVYKTGNEGTSAGYFRTNITATLPKLCSLRSNFDQEVLDSSCAASTKSSKESLMLEKNGRWENFQFFVHKYDVGNAGNTEGHSGSSVGTSTYISISKTGDHISDFDHTGYDEARLHVKFPNNYSVIENIQLPLKSEQTTNLADIRHCFNNNFSILDEFMMPNLCPKFNEMLFAKLEKNTKNCYESGNSLLVMKYKVSACAKIQNEEYTNNVSVKSIKEDSHNNCEGVNTNTSLENDGQEIFYTFPNATARIKEKCSEEKNVTEIPKEMSLCIYQGCEKKEESCNSKNTLYEDRKTNYFHEKNSCENQNKAIIWSNLEHFMEDSSDESDILLNSINDLENELDFPNLPEAPCNSGAYRICKHEYHFHFNKGETSLPEFKQDSKRFNNKNKEQNINAYVETGGKIQDIRQSLKPFCKTMNKDCELNECVPENIAYSKLKNDVDYDTDSSNTSDRYSYVPMIHKGEFKILNPLSKAYGNEILRSESRYSKRKNVEEVHENATSKGYKKRQKTSTYEKVEKAKSWKYLEHFTKYSKDESDILLRNTSKQENELNFSSLSNSPSGSTRYKTKRNKGGKFNSVKNVKCKRNQEFDWKKRKANTQNSKFAPNHFYNGKTSKENINLYDIGRYSSIQSSKEIKASGEVSKYFGDNMHKNNYQIATRKKAKISSMLQNTSGNIRMCTTPTVMQPSKTKTVSKISNSNTTNQSLLSAKNLKEKSNDQVEKRRKFSTGSHTGKTLNSMLPTAYQNFMPDSELSSREESMECEIFPNASELRAEKYKISKTNERKRKNSQLKIRKTVHKPDRKSQSKPERKHHSVKCAKTELSENKIPNRKGFCISKESDGKGSSEFKQHIKHRKGDKKKAKSVPDLVTSSYLSTFDSRKETSFIHENTASNNYHAPLVSKTKSGRYCCFEANESSSFSQGDFSEISSDDFDRRCESKTVQSSKRRSHETQNKQRKRARITHRKPMHISSYVSDLSPVDDLLLKSRRESIDKAYIMYTVLKPQNTRKHSHLKNERNRPKVKYSKERHN